MTKLNKISTETLLDMYQDNMNANIWDTPDAFKHLQDRIALRNELKSRDKKGSIIL